MDAACRADECGFAGLEHELLRWKSILFVCGAVIRGEGRSAIDFASGSRLNKRAAPRPKPKRRGDLRNAWLPLAVPTVRLCQNSVLSQIFARCFI